MKAIVILSALLGVALARPQGDVTVTRSEADNQLESFSWASELSDGTKHEQSGQLKQIGDAKGIVITGSYSYVNPEGETITINYIADENGFQPQGASIPTLGNAAAGSAPRPVRVSRPKPRPAARG